MQYSRKLFEKIKSEIKTREIVVVTGMRRVGKTTLLHMISDIIDDQNKTFLDMENPLDQSLFDERDYNNIWSNLKERGIDKNKKAYLFLDEIQAYPEAVKAIKYLYDHYDVKFFVTGSSSFYLKNLFPESLSGRKIVFEMFPLDFEEYLIFQGEKPDFYDSFIQKAQNKNKIRYEKWKKHYDEYIDYGGFPQVALEPSYERKKTLLRDIFKSYFEKDVQFLSDFRDIGLFKKMLFLLLQRVGSKIDISKIANEIGAARETVYSYLAFLEGTYFISLVDPYSPSVDREISGAKKIYFCDTGIVNQIGRVEPGSLLENAVFNNLKNFEDIRYYQRRSGAEIDFILPEKKIALEVKTVGTISDKKLLQRIADDLKMAEFYIITKSFIEDDDFICTIDL